MALTTLQIDIDLPNVLLMTEVDIICLKLWMLAYEFAGWSGIEHLQEVLSQ